MDVETQPRCRYCGDPILEEITWDIEADPSHMECPRSWSKVVAMDVEKRAQEVSYMICLSGDKEGGAQAIAALVREAVAEEREACADAILELQLEGEASFDQKMTKIAQAIRARNPSGGEKKKVYEDTWDERDEPW